MNAQTSMNIYFDPLIAQHWLIAAAVFGALLFIISFWKNRKGTALRLLTLAVFILTLANPSLLQEQREAISDVAVVVVDQSPSQSFGQRESVSLKALEHLKSTLSSHKDLELRIVSAPDQSILANETLLFSELEKAFSDVVPKRRAGVIFITDGQIHDVPDMPDAYKQFGPIHTLLSGRKNEKDRQLVMLETPSYGIVGQSISLRYKIEDTDNINSSDATMTIKRPGSPPEVFVVPVNQELDMSLPVDHAGQNIFEISVQTIDGEITAANNRAGLIVNGVRDRLKVLLVSGMPHAGGRTWRDLLSSDPGVDLVHFTILREPTKLDATPQNELALIAFPFRELFEVKLYDFDLIIFDRYRLNRILPDHYFSNIVRYVEDGGALLVASGPDFSGEDSLFKTQLKAILPGSPTGEIISKPFRPTVTEHGKKHPVTKNLSWKTDVNGGAQWGHWLRQTVLNKTRGDVLMSGNEGSPLLILDRTGQGRVAQIASDHISLWARGYDGGGPHSELLRRTVHWLMKEPELDENALDINVSGKNIFLRAANYKEINNNILMIGPDGQTETLTLEQMPDGTLGNTIEADQLGIYSFENANAQVRYAVVGVLNPPELRGVKTTETPMRDVTNESGGGIIWLSETTTPAIKRLSKTNNYAGKQWIGLKKNNAYRVKNVNARPMMPPWLSVMLLLGLVILTWVREGRSA